MSRHFLHYWKSESLELNLRAWPVLDHDASDQLYRVDSGDTIWVVTVQSGELILAGRLQVGARVDSLEEAQRRLGRNDLYPTTYHVIAKRGTKERLRKVNLMEVAEKLRFESVKDRLDLLNGSVDGRQLQVLRVLTPSSVEILNNKWSGT
jgi:hypothetical protein